MPHNDTESESRNGWRLGVVCILIESCHSGVQPCVIAAGLGPRARTGDAQLDLRWRPFEQRITHKLGVIVRSVVTVTAPEYITDL